MKRILCIILFMYVCAVPSILNASPAIYPVKSVFGLETATLEKAPAFSKWVNSQGGTGADILGKAFDAEFRKEFGPLAADDITDMNRHDVLVASLHLVRASQYVVPKMSFNEVSMPITLSIIITNPSTGETLYSFTKTSYATTRVVSMNPNDQGYAQMITDAGANYRSLVSTLIKETKTGYNPSKIEISVVYTWKGLYILDKGGKFGIVKGDDIVDASGNELKIQYASEDYAVATSLLGKVDIRNRFFKYATADTANQFKKQRVLSMHDGWNDPMLQSISFFFDSEISKESAFTLLPVSEHFSKLLNTIARDTHSGKKETTQNRTLPDYLIKFTATKPRHYTISEKGKFSLNIYEQYVVGELLDKQGRILYSAVASDRIEDQNVAGMVFDEQARLEILLKNATVNLAEQFSHSIKFSHFVLPVTHAAGKLIDINDISKDLRIGQEVTVYRNIGKVSGITPDVLIPLWHANVVEIQNEKTKLSLIMPLTDKEVDVSRGDIVMIDAISAATNANQSNTSMKYCSHEPSQRGPLVIDDFAIISKACGYLLPYTLYDQDDDFRQKIKLSLKAGEFKDDLRLNTIDTAGRCLLPVYRASRGEKGVEKGISCDDNGVCSDTIEIAVGYRLYINDERKGGEASKTNVTVNNCRQDVCEPVMQGELSKAIHELLKTNIIKLHY